MIRANDVKCNSKGIRISVTIVTVFCMLFSVFVIEYSDALFAYADSIIEVSKEDYESKYKNDPHYTVVNSRVLYSYRTRTKETLQSGEASLSGYTKYDTRTSESISDYQFGTPINTSTSLSSDKKSSITKSAVNSGYYYYAYTAANPNKTSDWTYYASDKRATVVSHMKNSFSSSSAWDEKNLRYFWWVDSSSNLQNTTHLNKNIYYCEDSTVSAGTTKKESSTHKYDLALYKYKQCYKVKTVTTSYYYYRYTDWSQWSGWDTNCPASSDLTEVKSMEFYTLEYHDSSSDQTKDPSSTPASAPKPSVTHKKNTLFGVTLTKVSKGKKSFTAKWKKASKKQQKKFSGYQIQYSVTSDFSHKVKTKSTTKKNASRVVIRKLKKKTTYYVRIRRFKKSGGKKIYSDWSNVKRVKTK